MRLKICRVTLTPVLKGHQLLTSYLVLTNCTARKRQAGHPLELSSKHLGRNISETARHWSNALGQHSPLLPAHQLYVGRSISDAKRVAEQLAAPMYVASAGFGLIHADRAIAPYDVTAVGSGGGLQAVLAHHGATMTQWWNALCTTTRVSDLLSLHKEAVLLVALPASYLSMLTEDLLRCPLGSLARVRIFTSRAGSLNLPLDLATAVMPYDERLESIAGYAGTRSDFPQRALKHFVEQISGHCMDQVAGSFAVQQALQERQAPTTVVRKRVDDDQIKEMLRQQWEATQGRSSILLRHLRDEALVACEQSRFARLWRAVRDEPSSRTA